LYCERADGPERRATQTVLHAILDVLVRLMAPVLSFTAEDVWRIMPGAGRPDSVLLAGLAPPPVAWRAPDVAARFARLLTVPGPGCAGVSSAGRSRSVRAAGTSAPSARTRAIPTSASAAPAWSREPARLPPPSPGGAGGRRRAGRRSGEQGDRRARHGAARDR